MTGPTEREPSVVCRCCGAKLTWEYPVGSSHYQVSSDYIGGDLCRSCVTELCGQRGCTPEELLAANQNKEDIHTMENIKFTLFQAPHASLNEHGVLTKMHHPEQPFTDPVPAQYYMPVFHGTADIPGPLPTEPDQQQDYILESLYAFYNRDGRPNPMTSRSMSVGDVVQLGDHFFLCSVWGFTPVTFQNVEWPAQDQLVTPGGATLQVSIYPEDDYPCINIDLIKDDGSKEKVCFVEHNPDKDPGHELCIGVYCSDEEDTVYYDSYNKTAESELNI